jgi:hypothetical protein
LLCWEREECCRHRRKSLAALASVYFTEGDSGGALEILWLLHGLKPLTAKFAKNGREGREEKHRAA